MFENFRWYDFAVIYFISDIASALLISITLGVTAAVMALPLLVLAWFSYENFRGTFDDKESD